MDKLLRYLTDIQIDWVREQIRQYPCGDWVWNHILWPITHRLYLEQSRRESVVLSRRYETYYKHLYQGQMLFSGPDGIPRSACYGVAKGEADRIMAYTRSF